MKSFFSVCIMITLISLSIQTTNAGVLITEEIIANGINNLADSTFISAVDEDSGLGAAVNYLLTENPVMKLNAKAAIIRAVTTAEENLNSAEGLFSDISSQKMYDALLMYDIMPDSKDVKSYVFTEAEVQTLRTFIKSILDYYLTTENFAWEDERWCLGASAMRIVASCVLYAINFQNDPDTGRYFSHSTRYLEKNLNDSIDDFGAWLPDNNHYTSYAIEYLIITAKAFRNWSAQDYFSNPRLKKLLLHRMHLLPPQHSKLVQDIFMDSVPGETAPGKNYVRNEVIAAADILPYDAEAASQLIWFWNQCGNPVSPLSILFITMSIPPVEPRSESGLLGGGTAILRNNADTPKESFVSVSFGNAYGIPYHGEGHYVNNGDFSFIWSGIPLVVNHGFDEDTYSKGVSNQAALRRNLVLYKGAGDSPALPESDYFITPVQEDITGSGSVPADFYPDGISQFLSTEMVDYISGPVRLPMYDMPAPSHYRHFLFLKKPDHDTLDPDALLIWDQIESAFPLEWNLWLPVKNTWSDEKILHLHTQNNIDLQVHFTSDEPLDFTTDQFPEEISEDLPLAMSTKYGNGTITFMSLDLFNESVTDSTEYTTKLFQNIILQNGQPLSVGIIAKNSLIGETVNQLGIPYALLSHEEINYSDLSLYNMLVIGDTTSALHDISLNDYGSDITEYIRNGGSVIILCRSEKSWMTETISGSGIIPVTLDVGKVPITPYEDGFELKLRDIPLWNVPNSFTSDDWLRWMTAFESFSPGSTDSGYEYTLPIVWSDSWDVLASVPITIPVKPYTDSNFGKPSRIRVRHSASKDFFTLFLPRRIGEPYYLFDIIKKSPGFISFADPTTQWEITAGKTSWTDANLSVLISSFDSKTLYAFDCTYIKIGNETIQAAAPMSIYYSELKKTGVIMTATSNMITYSKAELRHLHAGEIRINNLFGDISMERLSFVTTITVVDDEGNPVQWARVYVNDRFIGSTDINGAIPVRWTGNQPMARIHFKDKESTILLEPGSMEAVIAAE